MSLVDQVARHLETAWIEQPLLAGIVERDFQRWVTEKVSNWLERGPNTDLVVRGEASGGGVPYLRLLNTSFWPDICVGPSDSPTTLAVEVKSPKRRGLPGAVSHSIGQAMIYRLLYDQCLIVVIGMESIDTSFPRELADELSGNDISVLMLSPKPCPEVGS